MVSSPLYLPEHDTDTTPPGPRRRPRRAPAFQEPRLARLLLGASVHKLSDMAVHGIRGLGPTLPCLEKLRARKGPPCPKGPFRAPSRARRAPSAAKPRNDSVRFWGTIENTFMFVGPGGLLSVIRAVQHCASDLFKTCLQLKSRKREAAD